MSDASSDALLLLEIDFSSHRSIGLFILTVDLQYNGPSEVIPAWNLSNLMFCVTVVLQFQKTTYPSSRSRKRNISYRVSLCLFLLGSHKCNEHALRFALTPMRMPESPLHIPRWPLDQSEYSVVKWFAFLNKRPQRGRDIATVETRWHFSLVTRYSLVFTRYSLLFYSLLVALLLVTRCSFTRYSLLFYSLLVALLLVTRCVFTHYSLRFHSLLVTCCVLVVTLSFLLVALNGQM